MSHELRKILIEVALVPGIEAPSAEQLQSRLESTGLRLDRAFAPVPSSGNDSSPTLVFRGEIPGDRVPGLESRDEVLRVWSDAPIEPFEGDASFGF